MFNTALFSILFFSVCVVLLASGILVLLSDHKAPANRTFFALIIAIAIWSSGLSLATIAADASTCEIWRRFSAIGWGTAYAILLHFILIITEKKPLYKKWWFYLCLYLPALITVFAFSIPNSINPHPYQLFFTDYGWVNVGKQNIWDWLFYIYYISYVIIGLILLAQWGKENADSSIKKQSRIMLISIIIALILGSFTDVYLSSMFSQLPQMAPVIMLIPILSIYHVLKRDSFRIFEPENKKSSYVNITATVTIYVIISFLQFIYTAEYYSIEFAQIEESTFKGILTQLQMLISIYLVLKENKPGYIASFLLNSANLIGSVIFLFKSNSAASIPGIISYSCVLIIITLMKFYKDKTIVYINEINNQKNILEKSEKKLYEMAYFDSLTGLPNRDLSMDRLTRSIHIAKRNASLIGVMFVDIDSFKSVNDTAGHSVGDIVLKQIASRLSCCLREQDTVARFGGDELLILVVDIEKIEDIQIVSNRIMTALQNPFYVQDAEFFITASIGVSVYPIDGEDSDTLIKNADIAMYSAKNKGKNQCIYCTSDIKEDIVKTLKLTNSLYRALDKNELFLHYQPQVRTRTQEIIGFEALVRWHNEQFGNISPKIFIPMAEQTGLIRPIGLWVFKTACEQLQVFQKIYNKDLNMSINLSLLQLMEPDISQKISKILNTTKTNANNITIEITESIASYEEPYVLERIKDIKNLGISIAIDDFGTGHSSFSRLKSFPIDLLKIDMEFVQAISSESEKDMAIIKSIIQIAKNLGVEVLAEGIETEEQYVYLRDNACDIIQGYYFYKPMSSSEIEAILSQL